MKSMGVGLVKFINIFKTKNRLAQKNSPTPCSLLTGVGLNFL